MKQTDVIRYWLCESSLYDTKFEIDRETYEKVSNDLESEKTNYRMVNVTYSTIDFEDDSEDIQHDFYLVVDTPTFFQYSEIC